MRDGLARSLSGACLGRQDRRNEMWTESGCLQEPGLGEICEALCGILSGGGSKREGWEQGVGPSYRRWVLDRGGAKGEKARLELGVGSCC